MKDRTVLTLVLWLAAASPLAAQPFPDGPEFQVNALTMSFQLAPSVASDSAGNFVVAWVGAYRDSSFSGIGARRFDSAGNPVGDEFQVNTWTTGLQGAPVVAMDGTGRFVVVWTDPNRDGDNSALVARVFDGDAMPIGDDFQVNVYTTGRQSRPAVAMGSAGDFVVVWESDLQDGDQEGIFGRRFSSTGVPLTAEFQISDVTTGRQYDPTVSSDGAGSFVVVWTTLYPLQGGGYVNGLYGKLIDAGGIDLTGVEVVTVGDVPLGEETRPVVLAAREAMVNAAKHSGAGKVDVYVEAATDRVEVFVRDRGGGFDPDVVPEDRLGVRRSIVDRMERHGGAATVRSNPGEGTEVRLSMPLPRRSTEESR